MYLGVGLCVHNVYARFFFLSSSDIWCYSFCNFTLNYAAKYVITVVPPLMHTNMMTYTHTHTCRWVWCMWVCVYVNKHLYWIVSVTVWLTDWLCLILILYIRINISTLLPCVLWEGWWNQCNDDASLPTIPTNHHHFWYTRTIF